MPKIVDHDRRRRELAVAAVAVIGRDGIESATTRAVADEAGWSTGVLKHYFDGKDDLMRHALGELERRNLERFDIGCAAATGHEALVGALGSIVAAGTDEARVWMAFTARATVDDAMAQMMRRALDVWSQRWADLVRRGQSDGSIRGDLDPCAVAAEIIAFANGIRSIAPFASTDGVATVPTLVKLLRPSPAADRTTPRREATT